MVSVDQAYMVGHMKNADGSIMIPVYVIRAIYVFIRYVIGK